MLNGTTRVHPIVRWTSALCALAFLCVGVAFSNGALAQSGSEEDNPSGQELPRFASTRSQPVNVRVGPGTQYDKVFVFMKAGVPVEVFQEFDTWRRIRDVEGSVGWVHQNLLTNRRRGVMVSADGISNIALRDAASLEARVKAWLEPGLMVDLSSCDGAWCILTARDETIGDGAPNQKGYVRQFEVFGAFEGERFP